MTVFSVSTTGITLDGEGSTNNGTINAADYINPITGGSGLNTVRIVNTSAANVATITFTPQDVTYDYANLSFTTNSANGANAKLNITVAFNGYTAEVASAGTHYVVGDTIGIVGTNLGGSTTANDLSGTVTSVGTNGVVTGVSVSGTPLWPQSVVGSLKVLPNSEDFVQVTNTPATGCYFTGLNGDGTMIIQPVTIVG